MKKRFLSAFLTLTMVLSMVSVGFGTGGLSAFAGEGDEPSGTATKAEPVDIYWTRSKEFFYEELEKVGMSVYDNVLELQAINKELVLSEGKYAVPVYDPETDTYKYEFATSFSDDEHHRTVETSYPKEDVGFDKEIVPKFEMNNNEHGVIRTADGPMLVTNPVPTYYLPDLVGDPKLGIAYADKRLTTDTANTPKSILDAFDKELKVVPDDAMGGLGAVWDGGEGTYLGTVNGVKDEFAQLMKGRENGATIHKIGNAFLPAKSNEAVKKFPVLNAPKQGKGKFTFTLNFGTNKPAFGSTSPHSYLHLADEWATLGSLNDNSITVTSDNNKGYLYVLAADASKLSDATKVYSLKVVFDDNGYATIYELDPTAREEKIIDTKRTKITVNEVKKTYTLDFGVTEEESNVGEIAGATDVDMFNLVKANAQNILDKPEDNHLDLYKSSTVEALENAVTAAVKAADEALANGETPAYKALTDSIVSAARNIVPKDANDYREKGYKVSVKADTNSLKVKYLGKNSGYAGFIWETDYAGLTVNVTDGENNAVTTLPIGTKIVFESSDPTVLYISDRGYAYPKKDGSVNVTAKLYFGNSVVSAEPADTDKCTFNVTSSINTDFNDSTKEINMNAGALVGIYCNGVMGGNELGMSTADYLRSSDATENHKNQFATWITHSLTNIGEGKEFHFRGAETARRFTGYFEVSDADYINHKTFFLGNSNGEKILSGDDSMYVFINGYPVIRASTNAYGGVDFVDAQGNLLFDEANTRMLSNNEQDKTKYCNMNCRELNSCDINHKTASIKYAAGWHVHTDGSSMDIKAYIRPGQVNKIDIITGDYDDGGGMGRPYIYFSDEENVYQEGALQVEKAPFEDFADIPNVSKVADSEVYANLSADEFNTYLGTFDEASINGEAVNDGQKIIYSFIVRNTSENTTLHNVELVDDRLGISINKNGVRLIGKMPTISFNDSSDPNYAYYRDKLTKLAPGDTLLIKIDSDLLKYICSKADTEVPQEKYYITNIVNASAEYYPNGEDKPDYSVKVEDHDDANVYIEGTKKLKDDVVVIDYGLTVNVPVLDNDGLNDKGKIYGISGTNNNKLPNDITSKVDVLNEFDPENKVVKTDYGNVEIDGTNLKYTPTAIVDDLRSVYYAATEDETNYGVAEVKILPATSVYYEDNFSEGISSKGNALDQVKNVGIVYSDNWSIVNDINTDPFEIYKDSLKSYNKYEDGQRAELGVQQYNNTLYGNDAYYYNKENVFSNGSSHAVGGTIYDYSIYDIMQGYDDGKTYDSVYDRYIAALDKYKQDQKNLYDENYYATFEFKGTGFDIISHTTTNSGRITAKVYKVDTENYTYNFNENGELIVAQKNGEAVEPEHFDKCHKITSDNLYVGGMANQVPVISVKDLDADNYIVQLSINSKSMSIASYGNVVYVDAIRIYNSLDGSKNESAKDNYAIEERNTVNQELRDMILAGAGYDKDEGENKPGNLSNNKVIYLTDKYTTEKEFANYEEDLKNYLKVGPKNELYTVGGDYFTFTYDYEYAQIDNPALHTLQVEAKLIAADADAEIEIEAKNIRTGNTATAKAESLTSMFYNLSGVLDNVKPGDRIEIRVRCADPDTVLSITNLKFNKNVTFGIVEVEPKSITIEQGSVYELHKGETSTLKAVISPAAVIYDGYTWSSSNSDIISVDRATGEIKALGNAGQEAVITVTCDRGEATASITVKIAAVKAEHIEMYKNGTDTPVSDDTLQNAGETVTVKTGQTAENIVFYAKVLPDAVTDGGYEFSVDNESIATVSADKKSVTVYPGDANTDTDVKITVKSTENEAIKAEYTVSIKHVVSVDSIKIVDVSDEEENALTGTYEYNSTADSFTLKAIVGPQNAENTDYRYEITSANANVFTKDDERGEITIYPQKADADATVTIKAIAIGDESKTAEVEIKIIKIFEPEAIKLVDENDVEYGNSIEVSIDAKPFTIGAIVEPEGKGLWYNLIYDENLIGNGIVINKDTENPETITVDPKKFAAGTEITIGAKASADETVATSLKITFVKKNYNSNATLFVDNVINDLYPQKYYFSEKLPDNGTTLLNVTDTTIQTQEIKSGTIYYVALTTSPGANDIYWANEIVAIQYSDITGKLSVVGNYKVDQQEYTQPPKELEITDCAYTLGWDTANKRFTITKTASNGDPVQSDDMLVSSNVESIVVFKDDTAFTEETITLTEQSDPVKLTAQVNYNDTTPASAKYTIMADEAIDELIVPEPTNGALTIIPSKVTKNTKFNVVVTSEEDKTVTKSIHIVINYTKPHVIAFDLTDDNKEIVNDFTENPIITHSLPKVVLETSNLEELSRAWTISNKNNVDVTIDDENEEKVIQISNVVGESGTFTVKLTVNWKDNSANIQSSKAEITYTVKNGNTSGEIKNPKLMISIDDTPYLKYCFGTYDTEKNQIPTGTFAWVSKDYGCFVPQAGNKTEEQALVKGKSYYLVIFTSQQVFYYPTSSAGTDHTNAIRIDVSETGEITTSGLTVGALSGNGLTCTTSDIAPCYEVNAQDASGEVTISYKKLLN